MFKKIIVHKYGGKSLFSIENIKKVSSLVEIIYKKGFSLCIVVSAMYNVTDNLLKLSKEISLNPISRELDMLVTCGERQSIALLSISLNDNRIPSISLTGSQAGIITSNNHLNSKILYIKNDRIKFELGLKKVVIIAGFQGISINKEITTIGRGGSDTTAVALAISLKAIKCDIYTDIQGVYSSDPKILGNSLLLKNLNYSDALFNSFYGFKIINKNAVFYAKNNNLLLGSYGTNNFRIGTFISSFNSCSILNDIFYCYSYSKNNIGLLIDNFICYFNFIFLLKILNISYKNIFFGFNNFFIVFSDIFIDNLKILSNFIKLEFYFSISILSLNFKNNCSNINLYNDIILRYSIINNLKILNFNFFFSKIVFVISSKDLFNFFNIFENIYF